MYHKKKSDYFTYLFLLIGIACTITFYLFKIQHNFGPVWDTVDFLIVALEFAGKGSGYADLLRPPLMPFLTSLVFRCGYISEDVIYALDGILFILGVIGLYLLLNLRFDPLKSFIGCLFYSTFPIILYYVSIGLSDIPSVSFAIFAVYFTILAINKNSKFFYIAFPFVMLSFLTRYPMAMIIFPLFLYIVINRTKINYKKDLILGMMASLIFIMPFLIWSYLEFSNPFYPFISSFIVTTGISPVELFYFNPDILYFIKKLPFLLGSVPIAIFIISILGIVIYEIKAKFWLKFNIKGNLNRSKKNRIKIFILIILIPSFIITFGNVFYMFSIVIFLIICFLFYELVKNFKYANLDIDLLIFSWFMSFFIFHSVFVIKDIRYFLTMTPSISYFLILGLNELSNKFKFKIKDHNKSFQIISIIIVAVLLFSTTNTLSGLYEASDKESVVTDIYHASKWFKNYDPSYKDKIIYSDYYPYSTWYLRTDIKKMPILKDNKEILARLKEINLSNEDFKAYDKKLSNNNAEYYFCVNAKLNLTLYKLINKFGDVYIYQKI